MLQYYCSAHWSQHFSYFSICSNNTNFRPMTYVNHRDKLNSENRTQYSCRHSFPHSYCEGEMDTKFWTAELNLTLSRVWYEIFIRKVCFHRALLTSSPTLSVPVGTKRPGTVSSWQSSRRPLSSGSGTSRLSPLLRTHRRNLAASEPAASEAESLSPARSSAWRGSVTVGEIWNQK